MPAVAVRSVRLDPELTLTLTTDGFSGGGGSTLTCSSSRTLARRRRGSRVRSGESPPVRAARLAPAHAGDLSAAECQSISTPSPPRWSSSGGGRRPPGRRTATGRGRRAAGVRACDSPIRSWSSSSRARWRAPGPWLSRTSSRDCLKTIGRAFSSPRSRRQRRRRSRQALADERRRQRLAAGPHRASICASMRPSRAAASSARRAGPAASASPARAAGLGASRTATQGAASHASAG